MDSVKWNTIKEVFSQALEKNPDERSLFLAGFEDREIFEEVEKLLAAYEKSADFINQPFLVENGFGTRELEEICVGKRINDYVISEKIGEGGMGTVYLAERLHSDFKQKVALKLIKRGMDSELVLRRFRRERKILSTLNHPNIARLLDGGISSEGLPFFVMEYIEGKPLNLYCREKGRCLEDCLEIFRQICAAVEYAHKNLIIHRDLKPSNILVTKDGTPKLLDFGIAKLLSDEEEDSTVTATHGKMFTPDYASPEQILGKHITTAADVYSLGIILYELLTHHRPFETKGKSFAEIVKGICETEPPKPSETVENLHITTEDEPENAVIEKNRLRGDLDNIILKAIRKEPAERYGSAQQFSEDISRYLQGLPISARPQTLRYRFGKYVKRHRAGAAAAALIFVSLIGGISVSAWQAVVARRERAKAERRFEEVRKLANTILFDHYERIKNLPGATEARAKLVSDALIYLDKLSAESADNPDLKRELVAAYRKLAEIQGTALEGGNLGDENSSRENYLKALQIQENLAAADSSNVADTRTLGKLYLNISDLFTKENERPTQAEYVEKGLRIFQNLKDKNPNKTQAEADLANALWSRANVVRLKDDNNGAIGIFLQAAEIYENLGSSSGEDSKKYKRNAALTYKNIGAVYAVEKDFGKALEFYRKAFAFDKENAANSPENVEAQMDLSFSYKSLAQAFFELGEKEKSFEANLAAAEIQEKIFTGDAKNKFAAKSLFRTYTALAENYADKENFDEAANFYQKAKKILEETFGKEQDTRTQTDEANFFRSYGNFFIKKSRNAEQKSAADSGNARENLLKAKEIYQSLQSKNVLDPAFRENIAQTDEALKKIASFAGK